MDVRAGLSETIPQTQATTEKPAFETATSGNNGKVDLQSPPAELFLKEECCEDRQLPETQERHQTILAAVLRQVLASQPNQN